MRFMCFALVAALTTFAPQAQAAVVTYYYQMTVDSAPDEEPLGVFAAEGIVVGATITGTIVFDTSVTNSDATTDTYDIWALVSMTSSVGDAINSPTAAAWNDNSLSLFEENGYQISGTGILSQPGVVSSVITMEVLGDFGYTSDGSGIDVGLGLGHSILTPPTLSGWEGEISYLYRNEQGRIRISTARFSGSLSLEPFVTPVPLPAGAPLLLAGLAGLAALRRRRRAAA